MSLGKALNINVSN